MVQRVAGAKSGVVGTVKSYNGRKGYGFITCSAVGGDVFFGKDALPEDAREVQGKFLEGRSVNVDLAPSDSGSYKASKVTIIAGEDDELAGVIKSFNHGKGYGFVTCSSIADDVRFQASDFQGGLTPGVDMRGELVRFKVQTMPDGKLRAATISFQSKQIAQKVGGATMAFGGGPMMMGGGGMMPMTPAAMMHGVARMPGGAAMMGAAMMQGAGAMMMGGGGGAIQGVVKSFNPNKGYGFINMPGVPMDFKFGKSDIQGTEVSQGMSVQFTMAMGDKGMPVAKMVRTMSMKGIKRPSSSVDVAFGNAGGKAVPKKKAKASAISSGEWMSGSIKSFNVTRGFGFINGPDLEEDAFFMKTNLPPGASSKPLEGQAVSFEVMRSADGRMQAQNITFD